MNEQELDSIEALLELAKINRRVVIRVRRLIRQGEVNNAYKLLGMLEDEFTSWIASLERIVGGSDAS